DIVMSLPRRGLALVASKPFEDGRLPLTDGFPAIFEEEGWKMLEVSALAGMYMACNALPVNPEVLIMASNSLAPRAIQTEIAALQDAVRAEGIKVHTLDYGYHGFNGGAMRCSTHPLRRDSKCKGCD
ncbi:hypothetical protein TeGR_g9542, partial [Tetraparma gracilis]